MENKSKIINSNEKGITLVALVVTIIVLIILAGISMNLILGENGIIKQASRAKEESEQAALNEKYDLEKIEDIINESQTGIVVEQVTDEEPGVLEGTGAENDPYVINSIEDLVVFAYDVTKGNSYEGKIVKLGLSLDFNSTKSYVDALRTDFDKYGYEVELKTALTTGEGFKGIGSATKVDYSFAGTFDGDNNQIYNCYMHKDATDIEQSYRIALFGYELKGKIKNLGLINIDYYLKNKDYYSCVSSFSGIAMDNSSIENCFATGKIVSETEGNGDVNCSGIVTYTLGKVEHCYSLVDIYGNIKDKESTAGCYIGGIVINAVGECIKGCYNKGELTGNSGTGFLEIGGIARYYSAGKIVECYNEGNINANVYTTGKRISCGGIVGYNVYSEEQDISLENVYNEGNINIEINENSKKTVCIGGIIGNITTGDINNAYNKGKINVIGKTKDTYIGEIAGVVLFAEVIINNNVYYMENDNFGLNNSTTATATKITEDQLKSNEILSNLNSEGTIWKKGQNGYPVFTWQ